MTSLETSGSRIELKDRRTAFLEAFPPSVLVSLGWIGAMLVLALAAPFLAPHDYLRADVLVRLQPPLLFGGTWEHPLGTDELGRDLLSRLLVSIRISIVIALVATLISTSIGLLLGFAAAYFRGWTEEAILVLVDAQLAMPFMIIAIAVLAFFGDSLALFVFLLGFNGWEAVTRIARGLAISATEQGYAQAARDIGASPWRIYFRHILPNIAATIIVAMTLNVPGVIMLESSLSFLGIGIQPPETSLGSMVGYGRRYLQSAPWILLMPSCIIVLTTLSISLVGDWLRDRLDPTMS
ncbi:MAG: ABC transporter permease [Kiloniellales bacterium]|nr:ABC transporter permease [Kiloniellales bacterium]